ncbi:hypothetical protein [Tamlana flava]|uniref:hypothetical protein n=1 Tax=Tamlana flava TaxID=3158572 RepID=UPI00351AE797
MKKLFFFVVMLTGTSFTMQSQTVRYVDNNPSAPTNAGFNYTTVQAAIDASVAGDIIYIQPSPNSYGDIQMNKRIILYGIAHNPELNAGQTATVSNILFRYGDASGSKISGLVINGIYLDNGTYQNNNVIITNNRIATIQGNSRVDRANQAVISGNFFYSGSSVAVDNYNSQDWLITNNTFSRPNSYWGYSLFQRMNNTTFLNNNIILSRQNGDGSARVQLFTTCNGTQIKNNIFVFVGTSVADFTSLGSNSSLFFQNNLTYAPSSSLNPLGGSNIDDQDPLFVSFNSATELNNRNNDLHLQGGSPGAGAGTDGFDLGLYNGTFPYSIPGYPTELPYLTDFVINNNILSEGTDLNINVKANANTN